VKILILTNLYPPHHAGTNDFRCERINEALRLRGHLTLVLTSMQGMMGSQSDAFIERRLMLNGVFNHPKVEGYNDLKKLELHNNAALSEVIAQFQPEIIHVFSLHGLSKSLMFTIRNTRIPTVFDVADYWLAQGVKDDPWLRWWNAPSLPFASQMARTTLESSGERGRLDTQAPTRMKKGFDRLPGLYGSEGELAAVKPNSLAGFRFERIYFASDTVKRASEKTGFQVGHGDVIRPGVRAEDFVGEVKDASKAALKLLVVAPLTEQSGVMTAVKAVKILREGGHKVTLSVFGRGETKYVADLRSFTVTNQLPVEFQTVSSVQKDLPGIYQRHDIFLHTPEWKEPFSTAPLEAMAAGVPVVCVHKGGGSELVRHGENGLLYETGDPASLAANIGFLLNTPTYRQTMCETAQPEVFSKYNESVVIDQIETFLLNTPEAWGQVFS
jgi:glycogen(starch) synthase